MSGDEMTIINPKTGEKKLDVDAQNEVKLAHECTFLDFDEDSRCTVCGMLFDTYVERQHFVEKENDNG